MIHIQASSTDRQEEELPLEYAIEMNRLIQIHLIQIQMGGSDG